MPAPTSTHVIIFDIDLATGERIPITPEEHWRETDGFNTPPVEMTRAQRQRFHTMNRKLRKKMDAQQAYCRAVQQAMQVRA